MRTWTNIVKPAHTHTKNAVFCSGSSISSSALAGSPLIPRPIFVDLVDQDRRVLNADALEREIWTELAEDGVLLTPGWFFNASHLKGRGHFRIAFSYTDVRHMFLISVLG